MPAQIFKAYDIRGLSPAELSPDAAYRVGQAMVKLTQAGNIVVGRDMRGTTPALFRALSDGIASQGANVIDIGLVTTPMLYFAVGFRDDHEAGVMITASHNPKEYNGLKLCYGDVMPIGAESGMADLRDIAASGPYPATGAGAVIACDIRQAYIDRVFSMIDARQIRRIKAVVDAGNGMAGAILPDIFARLPTCEIEPLFFEPDGDFPNHEANPLDERTLETLKRRVIESGADIGIAFDGDGDRIGLVDERGETVRGDLITALVASRLPGVRSGGAALWDVRGSLAVAEEISAAGGRPVMCRVGHGLIKPQMKKEQAIFAGELSNHYYFRDFYGCECSDLVMLSAFGMLSAEGKSLSEIAAPLRRYAHSGEINFKVADKDAVIAEFVRRYGGEAASITTIDGLRLDFSPAGHPADRWWFSVRASNTEPLLRLNIETARPELTNKKKEELSRVIGAFQVELQYDRRL